MNDNRPVNLDLTKFHFPIMAIISILHRLAGVLLFFAIPYWLYLLSCSLASQASYAALQQHLATGFWWQLGLWVSLAALSYHLVAGVRHLFMDFGFGEELRSAKACAWVTLVSAIILMVLAGVWVW